MAHYDSQMHKHNNRNNAMNSYVTIGADTETDQPISIGDIERRSGLYILGKPGMGKTSLMVNMALSDMENGHGVFFLDPHGDAIDDIVIRLTYEQNKNVILLDPTNEIRTFGINLTSCKDVSDLHERSMAYNRAYGIFEQIWHAEFKERPWLQLITSHTLKVFIENQDYTLAEVPRFLRDETFRNDLVKNVKYNWEARDFWQYEFAQQRARDQEDKTDPTRTRLYILLAHEYIRDIIGQVKTTLDFSAIMRENKIVLLKLPANLSEDKKILGATAAAANKVFFQLAVNDARELAPEFAKTPTTTETRLEPELVISKEPFWELLRRGHKNPRIQELVRKHFQPLLDAFHKLQEQIDDILLSRTGYQSEATMYRDAASISGLEERRE